MNKIKLLKTKKGRDETGLFMVEGEKFVQEIPADWDICYYAAAKHFAGTRDLAGYKRRARVEILPDSLFDASADTITPQGIIAVCRQKRYAITDMLKENCLLLMGERLADPGNIGALIRTAAAAGADGIVLTEGSGDIYNPKVLRAAAGAVLRLPAAVGVELTQAAACMKEAGIRTYAAHVKGEVLPYGLNLRESTCFMVGNEAAGLSRLAAGLADCLIRLPMPGGIESLNASVAGSILLYEAVRQRRISCDCNGQHQYT